MKDQVRNTFDQLAPVYENTVDKNSLYNSEYERPSMINHLPPDIQGRKVLDAGCAAGWYTQQLLDKGAEVVAVDVSPEMVSSAKRKAGTRADIFCIDLEDDLPFEDQSFGLILSSLTLHYLRNWDKTFSEFQRILSLRALSYFRCIIPFRI